LLGWNNAGKERGAMQESEATYLGSICLRMNLSFMSRRGRVSKFGCEEVPRRVLDLGKVRFGSIKGRSCAVLCIGEETDTSRDILHA
jgi:hypothetical protein